MHPERRFSALSAETLTSIGVSTGRSNWETVGSLLDSPWVAAYKGRGASGLEAFLPLLCEMAADESNPDVALTRAVTLCEGGLPTQCLSRVTTGKPCAP